MTKHTTLPQLLLGMDEGIKEIRELLHNDADRKAHENALFTVAKHERLLDDLLMVTNLSTPDDTYLKPTFARNLKRYLLLRFRFTL